MDDPLDLEPPLDDPLLEPPLDDPLEDPPFEDFLAVAICLNFGLVKKLIESKFRNLIQTNKFFADLFMQILQRGLRKQTFGFVFLS